MNLNTMFPADKKQMKKILHDVKRDIFNYQKHIDEMQDFLADKVWSLTYLVGDLERQRNERSAFLELTKDHKRIKNTKKQLADLENSIKKNKKLLAVYKNNLEMVRAKSSR